MRHPNADVLQVQIDALARGDVAKALTWYTEDAVFHYPGRNRLSGDYRGKDQILTLLGLVMELTGGAFRPSPWWPVDSSRWPTSQRSGIRPSARFDYRERQTPFATRLGNDPRWS